MNLRQLEYLLAVARSGSFTLAAATVGVAQPTLTKSIKALEQELEVDLFERLPRGVVLTPYGAALLRHAERVDLQVQDAKKELISLRGGQSGAVSIGAGPAWLRRYLPQAVASMTAANPLLRVHVYGGFDDALFKALRSGDVDFVVAELPVADAARDLRAIPLSSDVLGACTRAGHPLVQRGPVALGDLLAFPWIMPPLQTRAQSRLNALFVNADLPPPNVAVETESMAFLLQYLRHSDALTFTVATTMALSEANDLVMLDVPNLASRREAGILMRKGGWTSPAALAVVGELQRVCALDPRN